MNVKKRVQRKVLEAKLKRRKKKAITYNFNKKVKYRNRRKLKG